MRVTLTALPEVLLIEPRATEDARGALIEAWRAEQYAEAGMVGPFVQDNFSPSRRGAIRGLHFQYPGRQAKLISVFAGTVFDVAVDVRRGSPRFGRWLGVELSAANRRQLWVPAGFAHGFCVLSEEAGVHYKLTAAYEPARERTVAWNDPAIGVDWPTAEPILSARDRDAPPLAEAPALPRYEDSG